MRDLAAASAAAKLPPARTIPTVRLSVKVDSGLSERPDTLATAPGNRSEIGAGVAMVAPSISLGNEPPLVISRTGPECGEMVMVKLPSEQIVVVEPSDDRLLPVAGSIAKAVTLVSIIGPWIAIPDSATPGVGAGVGAWAIGLGAGVAVGAGCDGCEAGGWTVLPPPPPPLHPPSAAANAASASALTTIVREEAPERPSIR